MTRVPFKSLLTVNAAAWLPTARLSIARLSTALLSTAWVSTIVLTTFQVANLAAQTQWPHTDAWQRETVLNNRRDHAMVYHADTREVILFGGTDRNTEMADTWAWNGKDWSQIKPASPPPARTRHAMVYNHGRQRLTLFGGLGHSKVVSDTWSLVPLRFRVDRPEVNPGGRLTFSANLPNHPNQIYLCVVAFHRVPGFATPLERGTVDIPMLPDYLTFACWNLGGFVGGLDAHGQAGWKVDIRKDERLAGVRFFAAVLALDKRNRVLAVTNDLTVAIVK